MKMWTEVKAFRVADPETPKDYAFVAQVLCRRATYGEDADDRRGIETTEVVELVSLTVEDPSTPMFIVEEARRRAESGEIFA